MAAAAARRGELVGEGFALTRLQLLPEERGNAARGSRRLFGVEPLYAAGSNQLSFDASLLARKLPGANPITAALCEQLCEWHPPEHVAQRAAGLLKRWIVDGLVSGLRHPAMR